MSDNELGKALLRGEDPIEVQALIQGVLRRDRRRMWILGIACFIAWMLVVMLPWGTFLPMVAKITEYQTEISGSAHSTPAQQREQAILVVETVKVGMKATFVGSVASMFVAVLCTISLITLSRRATLRQLNARLAEISAQIKVLLAK